MRILTRYVLFELLKVFLVSLTGMTIFMLLVGVFAEAYREGLGLQQVLLLIPYVLPQALLFAVPAAILFAACNVFGRMASDNEIVAVKASGINPWVLLWPALVLAFLLSLVAAWLNDVAVSWGQKGVIRVVIESVEEIAYSRLQQTRSYSTRQFSINVKDVDGKRMIRPMITFQSNSEDAPFTITCEEAEMRADLQANTLTVRCRNGEVTGGGFSALFEDYEYVIPLDDASRKGGGSVSPANIPMYAIPPETAKQKARIGILEQQLATTAAYQMMSGDFASLTGPVWPKQQRQLTDARQRLYRLNMEPYRRWANGFSCLCFVMVGAPLAIKMRNADFLTSFFVCFLPILILYYPLMAFGITQAKSGSFPPWSVWGGNAIMAAIGAHYIRRVCR